MKEILFKKQNLKLYYTKQDVYVKDKTGSDIFLLSSHEHTL